MFCQRHPSVRLQTVCDEDRCGKCFEEEMESTWAPAPPRGEFNWATRTAPKTAVAGAQSKEWWK